VDRRTSYQGGRLCEGHGEIQRSCLLGLAYYSLPAKGAMQQQDGRHDQKDPAMAMKEWFPHDYHTTRDVKIMRLIRGGGAAYYGMYWHVVEMLHYTPDAQYDDVVDTLQMVLRVAPNEVQGAVDLMVQLGLFTIDETGAVMCERIARNMQARQDISTRRKEAATKRWDANAMQLHSKSNANAMLLQDNTVQDKREENNTKVVRTDVRRARPADHSEAVAYFAELSMPAEEAQRFTDYYTANGWKVGRNPMKDWKAAARNWRKGFTDKQSKQGDTTARTAPKGMPAEVVEISNRPKMSQTDVDAFKKAYLSKVSQEQ
jgi:hypothetical protein